MDYDDKHLDSLKSTSKYIATVIAAITAISTYVIQREILIIDGALSDLARHPQKQTSFLGLDYNYATMTFAWPCVLGVCCVVLGTLVTKRKQVLTELLHNSSETSIVASDPLYFIQVAKSRTVAIFTWLVRLLPIIALVMILATAVMDDDSGSMFFQLPGIIFGAFCIPSLWRGLNLFWATEQQISASTLGQLQIEGRAHTPSVPRPCIFCNNQSGSEEHLWAAWMHRLIKFAPINLQEADGPILLSQDPEVTINTVCHTCNNGWMSQLEEKNIPRLKPMLLNTPVTLDRGGMKLLAEWAVKTAMVSDSIKPRHDNENFFTPSERIAMRETRTMPTRTRVWIGALEGSHIGCYGTDFTIMKDGGKTRIGTGSVATVYAGHFVAQTVTEHLNPPYVNDQQFLIQPPSTICDERLVEIYPNVLKKAEWPPLPFTDEGPTSIHLLMNRWRTGEKVDKVSNNVPVS
jgi:hypothetical protein